jgi:hypothetical protein
LLAKLTEKNPQSVALIKSLLMNLSNRKKAPADFLWELDTGHNGQLTTTQFSNGLTALGLDISGAAFDDIMGQLDEDQNGNIDYFELLNLLNCLHAAEDAEPVEATITDKGDGTYQVQYLLVVDVGEGGFDVEVTFEGENIRDSPFHAETGAAISRYAVVASRRYAHVGEYRTLSCKVARPDLDCSEMCT